MNRLKIFFFLTLVLIFAYLINFPYLLLAQSSNFFESFFNPLLRKSTSSPSSASSNFLNPSNPPSPLFLAYLEKEISEIVQQTSPSVVSIVISKYVPVIERYYSNPFEEFDLPPELRPFFQFEFQIPSYRQKGYEKQNVGGGTGFIVSEDGLIVTNKHVVNDEKAEYLVYLNDGRKFPAKVLLKHPVDDLAILKINATNLKPIKLGDSDKVKIGQFVIAIGNALGEFQNTVSFGVVSGLNRNITASDSSGNVERLEGLIQTDAAINYGNSGGPLINIYGEVIGVNTAIVSGAQNIGFAIPINRVKKMLIDLKEKGRVEVPYLGIRYILVTEDIQKKFNLPYDYGAYIYTDLKSEQAVIPNSPASRAGLKEGDLILEVDGEKVTLQRTLAQIIRSKNVGQKITLKVWRKGQILNIEVILGSLPPSLLSQ